MSRKTLVDVNFNDIKIVNFNSPDKNIVNAEPNVFNFPAYDHCGSPINLIWHKAYSLYIPELPLGAERLVMYFDRYADLYDNPQSIEHWDYEGDRYYEVRFGEEITDWHVIAHDGYTEAVVTFDKTSVDGDIRASIVPGVVKSYTLNLSTIPEGVKSYKITRTPGLEGAPAAQTFTITGSTNNPTIYHGDILSVTAEAKDGFYNPKVSFSGLTQGGTVYGNASITVTSGGPKLFPLKVSGFGTTFGNCNEPINSTDGLVSITVEVTNSKYANNKGTYVVDYDQEINVYHGDTVKASLTTTNAYNGYLSWSDAREINNAALPELVATVAIKKYTVTIKPNNSGWGTVDIKEITGVAHGTSFGVIMEEIAPCEDRPTNRIKIGNTMVTATESPDTAKYNYEFVDWSSNAGTITSDTTIIANFSEEINYYTVTFERNNIYGSVSKQSIYVPYGTTWVVDNTGKKVTFSSGDIITATPNSDTVKYKYGFINWTQSTSTNEVKGNVTITANFKEPELQVYTVGYPAMPSTISSFVIYADEKPVITNPASSGSFTATYGTEISALATSVTGYENPKVTMNGSSITGSLSSTVIGNTEIKVTAGAVKSYTLYIEGLDEISDDGCNNLIYDSHISSVTIKRTSSPLLSGTQKVEYVDFELNGQMTIYHGDILEATIDARTGYDGHLDWTRYEVTSGKTLNASATVKTFTLSYPAKPATVSSYYISRTSSPYAGASTGTIVTGGSSDGSIIVYYGDNLSISAYAKEGYSAPTYSLTATEALTNITATVTGGTILKYNLKIPALKTGIVSCSITRTPSLSMIGAAAKETFAATNSEQNKTIYYGDSLTITSSGHEAYTNPNCTLSSTYVTGNVNATINAGSVKEYKITINGFGTEYDACDGPIGNTTAGLNSISITVNKSPYKGSTGTTTIDFDTYMIVYYGDEITTSISTHEAYVGSLNWTSKTIYSDETLTGTSTIKTYKLTMGSKPTGVSSYTVYRSSSPHGGAGAGNLSNNATLYYGDVLTAGASATEGYTNPTLNWTSWPKVTSDVTSTITAGTVKEFKLTISSKPNGVATHVVKRTGSTLKGASNGELANGATIYYGDQLTATATAHEAYENPTLNWTSNTKVTGNVTSTATAGAVKSYILDINGFGSEYDPDCGFFIGNNTEGLESITVTRTKSPYQNASTGVICTATVDDTVRVYYGDELTATIVTTAAYSGSLSWTTLTVTGAPSDLTGSVSMRTYTVSFNTNNSYGTIDKTSITKVPYGSSINVSGNKVTIYGTTVTATPKADTAQYDYEFSSWSNASGTITANRTITANFADPKVFNYTVTINAVYGTASPSSVVVPYGTTWSVSGNTINFSNGQKSTVTPNTTTAQYSYAFSSWSPTSGTVTGNTTVTGTCSRTLRSYTVNYPAKPTGVATFNVYHNGSAISKTDAKGSFTANYGDKVYATATADTGYNPPSISGVTTSSSGTTITGTTDITLRSGSVKTYTISVTGLDVYVEDACGGYLEYDSQVASVSLNRTSSPLGGGPSGSIGTFTYDGEVDVYHGDVITASAVGETGYNTSLSWTSKTITSSTTLTASASIKTFTVTIVSNNTGYGTVNKATITGVPYGTVPSVSGASLTINGTTVTASTATDTAQYDYSFGSWTNASGAITADRTITANFSRATKTYTVSIGASPSGYGMVSPTSVTGVPYGTTWSVNGKTLTLSNGKTVTATETTDTAQYDYSFSSWSATSGTVTGATSITANFTRATKSYTISYPAKPSGVASLKIYLDGTEKVTNPSSAGSFTASYGSKVYAVATSDTPYNSPSITGVTTSSSGTSVTGNISITVTRGSVKTFDIDVSGFYGYSTNACGELENEWGSKELNSITISRSSSQYGGGSTGTVKTLTADGSVSVYYGDVITTSASVSTGYQPNLSWTSKTITSNTSLSANPTLKTYTLTITNGSYGTVKRNGTALSSGATITHFDSLVITPTAATGYTTTASPNGTVTVSGNVNVTFTRTGNTYYVYYKQGLASSATNLPSTQSRVYPNATTIATNSMTKNNTSVNGYSITYKQGLATGGTLPSTTTASDTISYTANGWTTSSSATNTVNYANGAKISNTSNPTLYPNFTTSTTRGSVTVGTNSMTKTNGSEGSYWVTYYAGTADYSEMQNSCGDIEYVSPIMPDANRTYNTIKYTANGWTTGSSNTNDRDYSNSQTISNFSSALTLYPNFTTSATNNGTTLASSSNLYKYDTTANSYTVTYYQGNASSTSGLPGAQTSKNNISYTSDGWTTTSGSTTRTYANGASTGALSKDLSLYPCFKQTATNQGVTLSSNTMSKSNATANGYTVTYKQGSATSTTVPSAQTQVNTTTYTHGGWATSASGSKAYNKGAATGALSANLSLYPYFSSSTTNGTIKLAKNSMTKSNTTDSSYTITYNYNGSGAANTTATATTTRSYTANGWTTSNGSTSRTYTNEQTITPTGNITLYPCFSQSTSGGSVTLPTPTRTGHTFLGWYTAASGGTKIGAGGATYTPSANITLYAQWSANAYTLTVTGFPVYSECHDLIDGDPYLNSITVKRNGSTLKTFTSNGTATIYYGDTLTASASATTGYNASLSWTSKTVTGNVDLTGSTTIQKFTVSFGINTSGYGSVSPTSISNVPYGASISTSGNKITINGTTVTASPASASAQYSYAFSSWSNNTGSITAARTITANFSRSTRSYTISYPAKPTGVANFVIYLNGSAKVSNPTSAGSFTASYGAKVYATATAATNYGTPSVGGVTTSSSGTSVTGNISITCSAGAYTGPKWRTILSSSKTINIGSSGSGSTSVSNLKAGVPTKVTFYGSGWAEASGWGSQSWSFSSKTVESTNGVNSYSESSSYGFEYGCTLTMKAGSVSVSAFADGYYEDACDFYEFSLESASITITNIQQYY